MTSAKWLQCCPSLNMLNVGRTMVAVLCKHQRFHVCRRVLWIKMWFTCCHLPGRSIGNSNSNIFVQDEAAVFAFVCSHVFIYWHLNICKGITMQPAAHSYNYMLFAHTWFYLLLGRLTNNIAITIQICWKLYFAIIHIFMNQSVQSFAHDTTPVLPSIRKYVLRYHSRRWNYTETNSLSNLNSSGKLFVKWVPGYSHESIKTILVTGIVSYGTRFP